MRKRFNASVEMLRRGVVCRDEGEWRRVRARIAWVSKTMAALRAAQRAMDQRCDAAVDQVSEEEFERICDEEQAKVCAILDQLHAVRDRDEWPRELHWGGI